MQPDGSTRDEERGSIGPIRGPTFSVRTLRIEASLPSGLIPPEHGKHHCDRASRAREPGFKAVFLNSGVPIRLSVSILLAGHIASSDGQVAKI